MWQQYVVVIIIIIQLVESQDFQCSLEKLDSVEYCIFRNVKLGRNMDDVRFTYPNEVNRPNQVAFLGSNMRQLPSNFLKLVGPDLKILRVENCGLESITITSGLEALHAKNNLIEKVIVHQSASGVLRMLDLSENQLSDVSNVTRCQTLEVLNLSGNKLGDVLDLGKFRGMNNLRKLDLSHNDINYLDNTDNVNLESLEDLDLSHNNILPSDLNMTIFYPYTKLHTLRLNDNHMSQLDYNHLLNVKLLKTIYLNGNNFKCSYLDSMLKHLQQNGLQTPPGETGSCFDKTFKDFCCTGPLPTTPPIKVPTPNVDPIVPQTRTSTEQPNVPPSAEGKGAGKEEDSPSSIIWIAVGTGIVVVVIAAVIGVMVWRKKQNTGSNYRVPPGNIELSSN